MRAALIIIGLSFLTLHAYAQEKCATMSLPQNINRGETVAEFEVWLTEKKIEKRAAAARSGFSTQAGILEVPVVFHVVHDGSLIGSGSNISDDKILEQLDILNEDFRRSNADASETHSQFRSVAVDTEIEFVMARQDPEGLPTDGIVRIQGSKDVYSSSDDRILTSESFWPQDKYVNIYITDLNGSTLGLAQFPFSNLEGIASELENYKSTDGLILDYKWVGINENTGSFDSYGRTATHEMGHYLGLRHIWGDGGCAFDDFCDDTPLADGSTSGCPTNKVTCDSKDMFQNYMDYTNDVCMNLFTICQKERMRLVLEQSPRRKSLLTSPGLEEPQMVSNDLGIRSIVSPIPSDCRSEVTPSVEVRNYGDNDISQFQVNLLVNGNTIEQKNVNIPLATAEITVVSFSPIILSQSANSEVAFEVASVNGTSGGNDANDRKSIFIAPYQQAFPPYLEDFTSDQNYFRITEQGEASTWTFGVAPDEEVSNIAAIAPFYNQEINFGQQDLLQTVSLDLSGVNSAELRFKYAYAPRLQEGSDHYYLDGLIVAVSTDCGETFQRNNYLFERYGNSLQTSPTTDNSFIPSSSSDWSEQLFNITGFAGQPEVKIAFIGVNGGGNNLYIDDVFVSNANLAANDGGIKTVRNAPIVTCETRATSVIEIRNYGYEDIESAAIRVTANGSTETFEIENLDIRSGESGELVINLSDYLQPGENEFTIELTTVNNTPDQASSNNTYHFSTLVEDSEEPIPVKEDFEDNTTWSMFSPDGQMLFDYLNIEGDRAIYTDNFEVTETSKSYLVTPSLTTGGSNKAGLYFKYSYAQRQGRNDNLKVLLSIDCGKTYGVELLSLNSEQLAVTTSSTEWVPSTDEDWRSVFLDLTDYVHYSTLRVAFVFSNGNGNRLYLDDINIRTTNDPLVPDLDALNETMVIYPNPTRSKFSVSFNYHQKNLINIKLVDVSGRVVFDENYQNIVNDKITFLAPNQSGFYFMHITGTNGINQTKRVYVQR